MRTVNKEIKLNYFEKEDLRRFKHWLIDNDLTMEEFAKRIGTSPANLSRYINGKVSIPPKIEELFIKIQVIEGGPRK